MVVHRRSAARNCRLHDSASSVRNDTARRSLEVVGDSGCTHRKSMGVTRGNQRTVHDRSTRNGWTRRRPTGGRRRALVTTRQPAQTVAAAFVLVAVIWPAALTPTRSCIRTRHRSVSVAPRVFILLRKPTSRACGTPAKTLTFSVSENEYVANVSPATVPVALRTTANRAFNSPVPATASVVENNAEPLRVTYWLVHGLSTVAEIGALAETAVDVCADALPGSASSVATTEKPTIR